MLSWGRNDSGQLGVGDLEPRQTPTRVLSSSRFISVACGSRTTLGVSSSGNIVGWGAARTKVLGEDIEDEAVTVPRGLEGIGRAKQVATRGSHVVALDDEGSVYTWGRGEQDHQQISKPLLLPFKGIYVVLVGAGRMHSAAVDANGNLFTWGSSDEGQTGLSRSSFVQAPTAVRKIPGPVRKLSCGSRHTLIVVDGPSGGVFGFGGNSYSQLGLGDKEPRFEPTRIRFGDFEWQDRASGDSHIDDDEEKQPYPMDDLDVACGYRHSFIYSSTTVWSFGWNSNYQCSPSSEAVISHPTKITFEDSGMEDLVDQRVFQVAAGGRHSLVLFKRAGTQLYSLVSFGRAVSGELGIPRYVEEACQTPILVLTLSDPEDPDGPRIACGWEHSVISLAGSRVDAATFTYSWFSSLKGDVDAALAQLINCMVILRLVPSEVQPSIGATVALSNVLFGMWASLNNATALPHGVNTVALFAVKMGAYEATLAKYPKDHQRALNACYFCTISIGLAQMFSAHLLAPLMKRYVPRSALAASVGGIALAFITTRFTADVFSAPRSGMAALLILLVGLGARERMPLGIPVAFVALFVGWLVSKPEDLIGYGNAGDVDDPSTVVVAGGTSAAAVLSLFPIDLGEVMFNPEHFPLLFTVVLPLSVVNVVNNLACIEQARASGDLFKASTGLLLDAAATLVGAIVFGSPFSLCIYVGHSSFKAMGATAWYAFWNAILVSALVFKWSSTLVALMNNIPQAAMVGVLVWIGSVVTAEAFKSRKHGVAVSIALVPSLAAWKSSSAIKASKMMAMDPGMTLLSEGYMLNSMILGAVVAHVLDRRFSEATLWLLCASALSFFGWIHESRPADMAEAYLVGACVVGLWAFGQWRVGEREAVLDDDGDEQQRNVGIARMATLGGFTRMPPNSPRARGKAPGDRARGGGKYGAM